jgi:hypothetical protein
MATAAVYGNHLLGQYSATAARRVDWVTDTIKCTLHTATYAPNQDTHTFASDLTNELATGGGYTAGGVTLASKTTAYDSATNQTRLDAADVSWAGMSNTFRYAVVWKDTGTAATSPLIGYVDLGATTITGTTFTIQWDPTGVVILTAT